MKRTYTIKLNKKYSCWDLIETRFYIFKRVVTDFNTYPEARIGLGVFEKIEKNNQELKKHNV